MVDFWVEECQRAKAEGDAALNTEMEVAAELLMDVDIHEQQRDDLRILRVGLLRQKDRARADQLVETKLKDAAVQEVATLKQKLKEAAAALLEETTLKNEALQEIKACNRDKQMLIDLINPKRRRE